ncbi:hypothetical protein X759_12100 [Mesorhizobium sp. LSHC420B00]|nr:hypothetical protein X759_12100 [Mesorhizobium sp. LSHC420B00]
MVHDPLVIRGCWFTIDANTELAKLATRYAVKDVVVIRSERMAENEEAMAGGLHIRGELLEALVQVGIVTDLRLLLGAGGLMKGGLGS